MELFNQPLEVFNSASGLPDGHSTPIDFQLSIINHETGEELVDKDHAPSDVVYKRHKTPMLHDIIPNQVFYGQEIQWMINPLGALHGQTVENDLEPVEELRIGDATTDWEGFIDSGSRIAQY